MRHFLNHFEFKSPTPFFFLASPFYYERPPPRTPSSLWLFSTAKTTISSTASPPRSYVAQPASPWPNPHVGRAMKINPYFICLVGQPDPYFVGLSEAGLCGVGRPTLSPLILSSLTKKHYLRNIDRLMLTSINNLN